MEFNNEYSISREAQQQKLPYLIHLSGVCLGVDHIALKLPTYEMTLRAYLRHWRDRRQIGTILMQAIQGVKGLHGLGFVHRDLKPDNIMLKLEPL